MIAGHVRRGLCVWRSVPTCFLEFWMERYADHIILIDFRHRSAEEQQILVGTLLRKLLNDVRSLSCPDRDTRHSTGGQPLGRAAQLAENRLPAYLQWWCLVVPGSTGAPVGHKNCIIHGRKAILTCVGQEKPLISGLLWCLAVIISEMRFQAGTIVCPDICGQSVLPTSFVNYIQIFKFP